MENYCTVLDKLTDRDVLFVRDNCLSTMVGNPQRKVTLFIPHNGFSRIEDFRTHLCGGSWSISDLKDLAKTDKPFLVSKGSAEPNKKMKYPVTLDGDDVLVGGVAIKKEGLSVRNGHIYHLGKKDSLEGELEEYIPREKGDRKDRKGSNKHRKGSKGSKGSRGSKGQDGGDYQVVVPTKELVLSECDNLLGCELRNRILGTYQLMYPVDKYPLATEVITLNNTAVSYPNVLFSDIVNFVNTSPVYGLKWLSDRLPLISDNYLSNVNLFLQPGDYDLPTYGIEDAFFKDFIRSEYFCYETPIDSINTAYNLLQNTGITIVRGGGRTGGNVVFGGFGSVLVPGVTVGLATIKTPAQLNSGLKTIEDALSEYTKVSKATYDKIFCRITYNDGKTYTIVDPYVKYLFECIYSRVYGVHLQTPENPTRTSTPKDPSNILTNDKSSDSMWHMYLTNLRDAYKNNLATKDLLDICNYNNDTSNANNHPHDKQASLNRYLSLMYAMTLARYLNGNDYYAKIQGLPIFSNSTNYKTYRCPGPFNGVNFSNNFKLTPNDFYSDLNKPDKVVIAKEFIIPGLPLVFSPFVMAPMNYFVIEERYRNCYAMCLFHVFGHLLKEANGNNPFMFTAPKVYFARLRKVDSTPDTITITRSNELVASISGDYTTHAPCKLYCAFYEECVKALEKVKSCTSVLDTAYGIINSFVAKINQGYTDYQGKKSLSENCPYWFVRWNKDISDAIRTNLKDGNLIMKCINECNLAWCLYKNTNVLDFLCDNGFNNIVNAIRAVEHNSTMPSSKEVSQLHYNASGFLYVPPEHHSVIGGARSTFRQKFNSMMNKSFAEGVNTVVDIYEAVHANNAALLLNHYHALKPFHPKVSTTMFYSDFMKFVGGRQSGGISMPQLYKEMFPCDINMGVQKFASPVAYPHLDFSVINAFVNSEYFLFNSVNSLFRAPRSIEADNPYDERTKSLL